MSEENPVENRPEAAEAPPKTGLGCGGWLGIVILIVAVCVVVFHFIVRPALARNGSDVDARIESWSEEVRTAGRRALDRVRGGGEAAQQAVSRTGEELKDTAEGAAGKVGDAADRTRAAGAEVSRKAQEKAERAAETVEAWY